MYFQPAHFPFGPQKWRVLQRAVCHLAARIDNNDAFIWKRSAVLSLLLKDDNNFIFLMNSSFGCQRYIIIFDSFNSSSLNFPHFSV